jgi:glycosyltransferase involved in cell wall biosynthesis
MTSEASHAEWEPLLARAGYRFVWFDGLNRFYLAAERHGELARHFTVPPNVSDDFIRVADTDWARLVHRAEGASAELRQRAEAAEAWGATAEARAATLSASLLRGHAAALAEVRASSKAALEFEWARSGKAEQALAAMNASTSWRITAPLRRVMGLLRKPRPSHVPLEAQPAEAAPEAPSAPVASRPAFPLRPVPADASPARRAVRKVHQFHSGASVGDAVTNGMLLTRGLLRRLGYESEIFVHRQDPMLLHEMRPLEDMPRHADQVLIVHHSLGHDRLDEVLSLPATKILCYHNITPPELLAADPWLAAHAELGRRQLHQLRPHVAASLAVSDFNAIELRALGFDPVQTCTLLFDVEALRAKATPRPKAQTCFTVLFVGRVLAAKGQMELVEAYIRFSQASPLPSRLVLIGRLDLAAGYVDALTARIAEAGIEEHVLILGHASDNELDAWYAAADLYVSLSQHEGFGVPLIEAATRGIPVLAWAGGAVPYTLDDPAGLLFDRDPDAVAARMLALATNPAALGALRQSQRRAAERFGLDRQVPALVQALALAGAAPPPDPATHAAMDRHLRVTVTGHANGSYSLASVNRALARALDAIRPGQARLAPVEGVPAPLVDVPDGSSVRALTEILPFVTGPHVVVSNHYPVHVPADPGDVALALFYWEESLIPPETIATLNSRFRGVLAATASVAKALIDSGLTIPVQVLGQAMDLTPFQALASRRARPAGAPVTFLHVSSCFPRKGVDVLLAAFARAFRAGDPVRLVIKGFPNPHNDVAAQIAALRERDPDLPRIELIDRDLSAEELLALYAEADAVVLPSRGEGFNMAAAEAMAAGLPLIVTGAGGHTDFCTPRTARLLDWRHAPSQTHLAMQQSLWFEPEEDDLVAALRDTAMACRDTGEAGAALLERTRDAAKAIAAATEGATIAARLRRIALGLLLQPPPRPHRIAVVTSWGVRCGVAEYTRHLVGSFTATDAISNVVVLADAREREPEAPPALTAWRMGDGDSMDGLVGAILREDADIVMVQHQPGLFGFNALATLLRSPVLRSRVVTVTLHTVERLEEVEEAERHRVVAALASVDRVIVHTLSDLERLRRLGLVANATLIRRERRRRIRRSTFAASDRRTRRASAATASSFQARAFLS